MPSSGKLARTFAIWNRKGHYYLGLYLLFFLWLFCFTGIILNHPQWTFAEFWPQRIQTNYTRTIQPPPASAKDLAQAQDIMRQLGVEGEIEWTKTRADAAAKFDFRVTKPGRVIDISVTQNTATVQQLQYNAWGISRLLHTFTGVRFNDDRHNARDWTLTIIWAYTMDALALGLILMVLTSLYLWWGLPPQKHLLGWIALGLGTLACGFFVVGLRWLT
jgi:hypothetical protein